ncbi:MAG: AAA family ATPase [Desulfamplus sp.]|nr:AAA family ATPase [Desulfamplus sp.]
MTESEEILPVGELLVQEGLVCYDDVVRALKIQKRAAMASNPGFERVPFLGNIMCRLNLVSPVDLYYVLDRYGKIYSIEDHLVHNNHLVQDQITALNSEVMSGRNSFYDLLLKYRTLSFRDLQKLILSLFFIKFRPLNHFFCAKGSTRKLSSLVDRNFCLSNLLIPLVQKDSTLIVGITSACTMLSIRKLNARLAKFRIVPVSIPMRKFRELFQQIFGKTGEFDNLAPAKLTLDTFYSGAKIFAMVSGKCGVGKKTVALNLAVSLALRGNRVSLFDGKSGLEGSGKLTRKYPPKDLLDVATGCCDIQESIVHDYQGIDIMRIGRCVDKLRDLSDEECFRLSRSFVHVVSYDYVLIDLSLKEMDALYSLCMASSEVILVLSGDPLSVKNTAAIAGKLVAGGYDGAFDVILNQTGSKEEGITIYRGFKKILASNPGFTNMIRLVGIFPSDRHVAKAQIANSSVVRVFPESSLSCLIHSVADRLLWNKKLCSIPLEIFWERCLGTTLTLVKKPDKSLGEQIH